MEILYKEVKGIKIPVINDFDKSLPIVQLKLVFKAAGKVAENIKGEAKMLSALLDEGTKSLGNIKFNEELERQAISLDISAGFETFSIEINCLKEQFDFACKALKSLLEEPNFKDEVLNKIKTQALGQIAIKKNDFDYQARLGLNSLLYPNTPLAYPSLGDEKSIKELSLNDLENFMKNNLNLENLFITFCGDYKFDDLNLNELLSSLNLGKTRSLPFYKTSTKKELVFKQMDTKQAYIYFGAPYNVKKEDKYLASVSTFILGSSGFGSRLMEEIRVKRGLAYGVYARNSLGLSRKEISGFMQTKNESKDEAIAIIKNEFQKFVENGVNADELESARQFLLGSTPLSKETLFKRMNIAQSEFYEGLKLGEFDRRLKKIKELRLEDLNTFIKAHKEILDLSFFVIYK